MFDRLGRQPVFDWYFSLVMFSVAIAVVSLLSVFFYVRFGHGETVIPLTESSTSEDDFDAGSVVETLLKLEAKREVPQGVRNTLSVNPSSSNEVSSATSTRE